MFQRVSADNTKHKHLDFFRKYFPISDDMVQSDGEVALMCPDRFHMPRVNKRQTDTPSFYVNVNTGEGYCQACKVSFTDVEGFVMEWEGVDYGEAKKIIEEPDPIPEALIDKWHQQLLAQPQVLSFLHMKKMLTLDTIKRFKIGWDGDRITTPVRNENGDIVNVRKYLAGATKKQGKVISYKKGYGRTRIFPVANLTDRGHKRLVMFGGEFKVMAADQESQTVTPLQQWASVATAGEGTMPPYLLRQFAERVKQGDSVLYLCMDIDAAGVQAAQRYANKLTPLGIECRMVRLPITEPANGDFNDYLQQGGSAEGFLQLLEQAEVLHVKQDEDDDEEEKDYLPVHLSEASHAHLTGKYIQTEVMVSGKDLHPYTLPKTVAYKCDMDWGEKCNGCGLQFKGGEAEMTVKENDPGILNMLKASDAEMGSRLKGMASITPKCPRVRMNVTSYMNIEEVLLIPELDFSAEDREYATRIGYFVGHGLRANKSYEIKARSVPDPRSQYATLIISEAHDGKSNIRNFQMTEELAEQLKVFQGDPEDVFSRVARDLSLNVTKIYGRDDIIKAADLVFHSPLSFTFMGKEIRKGYAEALIFGDTRTGKSENVQNMHRHYKLGEFMDCGNVTFAGLVGGMQQVGNKRWQITWGKIPLNNGGLVTADEFSSLSLQIIGDLTGIRSSGIAEITKIQTERTQAQVRLIALSNPREMDMTLSKFSYGIQGIRELIGRPEDIARFDFVLGVAFNPELDKLINRAQEDSIEHVFTSDLCHNLILWAWSRKPEQIRFSAEAEQACLVGASQMGKDFSPQFPIVISADQRIKIARLAASTAIRCFSTRDGETVQVEKVHVDWAIKFLYSIYEDPALGYREFSKLQNQTREQAEKNMVPILEWTLKHKDIASTLLELPANFKVLDLMDLLALDKDEARSTMAFLKKHGLISAPGGAQYRKEAHFIDILRNTKKYCEEYGVSHDLVDITSVRKF